MFATRTNNKQQLLPDLFDKTNFIDEKKTQAKSQSTGDTALSSGTSNIELLSSCLRTVSNSTLVRQRATGGPNSSVSDHLAAASVQTGASLPLMIGNRPKCVLNLVDSPQLAGQHRQQHQDQTKSSGLQSVPAQAATGPQNTAQRAEQRRQNMSVSVVRPVVVVNGNCSSKSSYSLIDDWMSLDGVHLSSRGGPATIDELLQSIKVATDFDLHSISGRGQLNMEHERQQMLAMLRREQHELERNIRRQHVFMMDKLEERKRHLSIVQSVWAQRDFKHAIEKLVDIYHQGLIFAPNTVQKQQLRSLNTSLVVDVLSIIILRPKMWTLEICQLLLPIINQDLLLQSHYEYYTEVGLKALKLILTHFSSIIVTTLESLKESNKPVGVDLSREERINKCLVCYQLLLESSSLMNRQKQHSEHKQQQSNLNGEQCKLAALQRELKAMFTSLLDSIQLDSSLLSKRIGS